VIALHFLGEFATGWGGLELPPYNRLYLGGENDLRGFDIRTVSPIVFIPVASTTSASYINPRVLDSSGSPTITSLALPMLNYQISFPGGDTSGVFNGEYRIPIAGPVSVSLFTDVGTVGILQKDQLQLDPAGYSNLAMQFPGASISRSLQIQPGTNFKLRTSAGVEFVIHLPVINAPFRLYWAYNFTRVSQQIVSPAGDFHSSALDNIAQTVGQTVYQTQILPQLQSQIINPQRLNFFEPLTTFRFAVSRTF
jgi:outer membrane protein insertion porin family